MKRGEKEGLKWVTIFTTTKFKATSIQAISCVWDGRKETVCSKNPHVEISKLEFKEMARLAKETFEKCQRITYERYKLFNRSQEMGESLESSSEIGIGHFRR